MILKTKVVSLLLIFISGVRCSPIQVDTQTTAANIKPVTEEDVLIYQKDHNPLGSAVAPIVGAVVGPLLINIANGITNGITTTLEHDYLPLDYGYDPSLLSGSFEAYLVDVPGENKPYVLLTAVHDSHDKNHDDSLDYYGGASYINKKNEDNKRFQKNHESQNTRIQLPEMVSFKRR